jgi:hypothetical protein
MTAEEKAWLDEFDRLRADNSLLRLNNDGFLRQWKELAVLLDRVPHHGPNGSYSKAEGQCWPDCVACAWEKLKS